jgi:Zn finger protein HypA/HybF involved in hydrogenase expression
LQEPGELQMRELSIALALVEMASEESARLGDVRVEALHVRIGPLSVSSGSASFLV